MWVPAPFEWEPARGGAHMTAFLPLGILGLGLAFILGVLNGFPVPNIPVYDPVDVAALDETYDPATAQKAADRFGAVYEALINDILSFQKNPDFQRAESRKLAMLAFGNQTATDLDIFAHVSKVGTMSFPRSLPSLWPRIARMTRAAPSNWRLCR